MSGARAGAYNKFSNEEKAIVIMRWLDYRIKSSKPIPLVMAALQVGDAPSSYTSILTVRLVICAHTCDQGAVDDEDDSLWRLKGMMIVCFDPG